MASMTMTARRPSGNGSSSSPQVGIAPGKRRQRSVPLAAVAAACMVASIVAFVGIQLSVSDSDAVLALARPVQAGATITSQDLVIAQIAADPALSPIPASERSAVIGRTAATDLAPGNLLVEASLGSAASLKDGEALVGVEVRASAAPIDALRPGDRVQIVGIDKNAEGAAEGLGEVITEGRVVRVSPGSSTASTAVNVSVVVPSGEAASVAGASVAQRAALVVIP